VALRFLQRSRRREPRRMRCEYPVPNRYTIGSVSTFVEL